MDAVFEEIARETVNFGPGDEEKWRQLYEPLYSDDLFEGVQVIRDERYGPAERNLLDVFVPPGEASGRPVMLFVHGGGFFSGDKRWSEKCYANIGCAFAKLGVVTVIGNHQLVPNVTYPGGAEDIQLTREWIYQNISASKYGCGSPDKVFLFGHSSGGAHIAANLYAAGDSSRPQRDPLFPPVAGVLYIDVPFWYDVRKPVRKKIVGQYYGNDAESVWGPKSAVGLFERLPADSPARDAKKLPTFLGSVEWEVPETADATVKFFNAYRAGSLPFHTLPLFHVLQNHNHLSNILSIGTTDTAQTDAIMLFINTCLGNQQKLSSSVNP